MRLLAGYIGQLRELAADFTAEQRRDAADAAINLLGMALRDTDMTPEHPYPASLDDCYAALDWITNAAADYGIDTGHVGVMGDSRRSIQRFR